MGISTDEYVLLEYAHSSLEMGTRGSAGNLYITCRDAARRVRPALNLVDMWRAFDVDDPIEERASELLRQASGAIVLLGRDLTVANDAGVMVGLGVPVFPINPGLDDYRYVGPVAKVQQYLFNPLVAAQEEWVALERALTKWMQQLQDQLVTRRATVSPEEQRAIEAFITAFYRAVDEGTIGLEDRSLVTTRVHVDTINLQLRAPEPSRSIIKEAVRVVGSYLAGVSSGLAASYLYDLLPHIH